MSPSPIASLTGISSMATRALLAAVAADFEARTGRSVRIESVGGVDAARRVRAGEAFDVVVLAADAIDKLAADGALHDGRRVDWVRSGVAIAVPAAAPRLDVSTADAVRRAVLGAGRIGYSTGPSGTALLRLFERWGIADIVAVKTVQAPPGVPVGSLVAAGEVDLGFQQLSELMDVAGIRVVGPMPPEIQVVTVFSAAVCRTTADPAAAADFLRFLVDAAGAETIRRHGMDPAW